MTSDEQLHKKRHGVGVAGAFVSTNERRVMLMSCRGRCGERRSGAAEQKAADRTQTHRSVFLRARTSGWLVNRTGRAEDKLVKSASGYSHVPLFAAVNRIFLTFTGVREKKRQDEIQSK